MIALQTIGAVLTSMMILMIWSWLYRQNTFFAFAEHTVVGIAAGYACVVGITNLNKLALQPIAAGKDYLIIVPIALGLLLFTRYSRSVSWISNYGMAVLVGAGTGIAMRTVMMAQVITQITATIPLLAKPIGLDLFNGVVLVVAMAATVVYFLYSREHRGMLGTGARIGRIAIMVVLGNLYGSAISTRVGHVAAQMVVLLVESAPLSYFLAVVAIAAVAFDSLRRSRSRGQQPK